MTMTSREPDWIELVMGNIDTLIAHRSPSKRAHRDFKARIQLSAAPAIFAAAERRNMSASAYLRRCALAFAAYDLDLDLDVLLADEPATRLKSEGPKTNRLDEGQGHGEWVIGGLS